MQQVPGMMRPNRSCGTGNTGTGVSSDRSRMRTSSASESGIARGRANGNGLPGHNGLGWTQALQSISQTARLGSPMVISEFATKQIRISHTFQVENVERLVKRCREGWEQISPQHREYYQFGAPVEVYIDYDEQLNAQNAGEAIFFLGERFASTAAPELKNWMWHVAFYPISPLSKAIAARNYNPLGINDLSDHLAVYVHVRIPNVGPDMNCNIQPDLQAKVDISLLDHNGNRLLTQSSELYVGNIDKRRFGSDKFIRLEDVMRNEGKGTLNFLVEVDISYRPSEISVSLSNPPPCFAAAQLEKLRLAERGYDVVITCSEGTFKCLRAFLSERCGLFMEYFLSDEFVALAADIGVPTAVIPGLDCILVSELIRFAYEGEISPNPYVAEKLLMISNQYGTTDLKDICQTVLIFALTTKNCLSYLQLAKECSAKLLEFDAGILVNETASNGHTGTQSPASVIREAVIR